MVAEGNITEAVPPHAVYHTTNLQVSRFTPSRSYTEVGCALAGCG
jgi:hypothetical protein